MLGEVFYWLFNMSITSTITGIIVWLIGRIKAVPRRAAHILWVIPLIRMWVLIGIGSKYSLMSLLSKFATRTVELYHVTYHFHFSTMNWIIAANSYFPITYKLNILERIFNIASVIWIIFAVTGIIAFGIIYGIVKHEIRSATHFRDNVYISEKVTSPAVYGVFRPRIILPEYMADSDLTLVLAHENAHIRRGDNLWRVIAFMTAIIHWFNPFAWLFLKNFLAETELACDARVLAECGEEKRKAYALTLVNSAEQRSVFASAFGGARIRIRVDQILSYKKLSLASSIFFIALAISIAYVLLTNAL
ncbi:MAG: peptidase M56 BlaR1 [Christensenellaceae bacterium]|nr:peptidase M56 BlaR1 [Christensenellaceae bacterium]